MDNHEKGGVKRRWRSRQEELDALRQDPTAQALLRDLEAQDPDRVDQLIEDLEGEKEEQS